MAPGLAITDRTASAPAPAEPVVGIDPGKVLLLASALGRASDRADWLATVLGGVLAEVGEDGSVVRPLQAFALWCDVQRVGVRGAADAIARFESGAAPAALGGFDIHRADDLAAFADPADAVAAAEAAMSAVDVDDRAGFADLLARWGADAVFAAVVIERLGPSAIVDAIDRLAVAIGSGLEDELRTQEAVVSGIAGALATARRTGTSDLTVGDLVDESPHHPAGEIALLFVGATVFDVDFLLGAFDQLVMATVGVDVDDGVWVAPMCVEGEGDARDSITLVLHALARNPAASARELLDADLQRLLVDAPYRDGGTALAGVLDAGTDPLLAGTDAPDAALRLITWVADRVTLRDGDLDGAPQLGAHTQGGLGAVAGHYIGSFRSDRNDAIEVDPVADQLRGLISGDQADRFLTFVARQPRAADALRASLVRWATAGVAGLSSAPGAVEVGPFTVLGDVGRRVSDAVERAEVSWQRPLDARRDGERAGWSLVQVAVAQLVDTLDPSSLVVSVGGDRLIDSLLPVGHAQLVAAKQQGRAASGDQLRLEQIALSVLWADRARNHLFDAAPPPAAMLDGSRLRTLPEVEEGDALELFDDWLARLAASGTTQLDRLGAEFGTVGARPAD